MKRSRKRKRPAFRNRNQTGWWLASYVERVVWSDEDRSNERLRCMAWENMILVRASSRDVAFRKAVKRGRLGHGVEVWSTDKKHRGRWVFEGLSMLLPVYDQLEDGSEVLWRDHSGKTIATIKRLVRRKSELEAFDDTPGPAERFKENGAA